MKLVWIALALAGCGKSESAGPALELQVARFQHCMQR